MIEVRSAVNREKIPSRENPEKVIIIVQEILNSNKQERGEGLPLNFDSASFKILSPKQGRI